MENCVYVFYNKLSNRYQGVFSYETDAVMQYRLGHEDSFNRDELEVCKIGTYDVTTGVLHSQAPTRIEVPILQPNSLPVSEAK